MTNTEQSTQLPSSNAYRFSDSLHAADGPTDDLAAKGAAAFREVKANVESVIADAGDKGQQAWDYAGKKGQEAVDNVREVGDTLAVAIADGANVIKPGRRSERFLIHEMCF
jgi:hypothetical protein